MASLGAQFTVGLGAGVAAEAATAGASATATLAAQAEDAAAGGGVAGAAAPTLATASRGLTWLAVALKRIAEADSYVRSSYGRVSSGSGGSGGSGEGANAGSAQPAAAAVVRARLDATVEAVSRRFVPVEWVSEAFNVSIHCCIWSLIAVPIGFACLGAWEASIRLFGDGSSETGSFINVDVKLRDPPYDIRLEWWGGLGGVTNPKRRMNRIRYMLSYTPVMAMHSFFFFVCECRPAGHLFLVLLLAVCAAARARCCLLAY
jgi:hypothetical protein